MSFYTDNNVRYCITCRKRQNTYLVIQNTLNKVILIRQCRFCGTDVNDPLLCNEEIV